MNLYDYADALKSLLPKPVKVLDNLTTNIDCVEFSNDSQILSVSSSVKVGDSFQISFSAENYFSSLCMQQFMNINPT